MTDPRAINQIYGHKTGFLKGPFYEDKTLSRGKLSMLTMPTLPSGRTSVVQYPRHEYTPAETKIR